MKKVLVSLLVIVFALSMAGCKLNTNNASQGKSESGGKKVEITFWHLFADDPTVKSIEDRVNHFNSSQDKITVKVIGSADDKKQLTAISGGNPPDIGMTYWNNIGPWATNGAVRPLTDFIKEENYDLNQFIPASLERMKHEDEYYAMPWTMSMASKLMWNKKVYEEVGIKEPPKTLEDLMAYAEKTTKKRSNGDYERIGFIPDYPWIDNVFWPIIFGGKFEENGQVTPDNPANVAAIDYQAQFYKKFGVEAMNKFKSGMGEAKTPQDPLLTGQIAMQIGWEYDYPEERTEDGPVGVAPFPYPADHPELEGSGMVSPRSLFIPKNAKHPEEAWEFMKYLLSEEQQVEFCYDTRFIPTVKSALDSQKLRDKYPTMVEFYEAAKSENLEGFPNSKYINEYLQSLSEETELVLQGKQSAEEAMNKVKEKIQPLADKANAE